jgi:hypothetical protein
MSTRHFLQSNIAACVALLFAVGPALAVAARSQWTYHISDELIPGYIDQGVTSHKVDREGSLWFTYRAQGGKNDVVRLERSGIARRAEGFAGEAEILPLPDGRALLIGKDFYEPLDRGVELVSRNFEVRPEKLNAGAHLESFGNSALDQSDGALWSYTGRGLLVRTLSGVSRTINGVPSPLTLYAAWGEAFFIDARSRLWMVSEAGSVKSALLPFGLTTPIRLSRAKDGLVSFLASRNNREVLIRYAPRSDSFSQLKAMASVVDAGYVGRELIYISAGLIHYVNPSGREICDRAPKNAQFLEPSRHDAFFLISNDTDVEFIRTTSFLGGQRAHWETMR